MTHEATRLTEEAKRLIVSYGTACFYHEDAADVACQIIAAIDALAALAQPAPTAEVALPAVSEEAPQGFWLAPNKLSREMIDEMGICGGTYQGWWEGARRAALRLARAQSAAKGDEGAKS